MKPALLIIDMLNDFFSEGRLRRNKGILVQNINNLVVWVREKKHPLIWIRQEFAPDLSDAFPIMRKKNIRATIKGTGGETILPELHRQKSDYEIVKKRYSSFFQTKLVDLLEELKVDTVVLAGVNTHSCIRMTAIDAYQRDYEVIVAKESVDSYDPRHHRVTLEYLHHRIADVLSNEEIKSRLNFT